jgi:hypothetical protein
MGGVSKNGKIRDYACQYLSNPVLFRTGVSKMGENSQPCLSISRYYWAFGDIGTQAGDKQSAINQ